ncbi:MAG: NifB/NifX family molybdenum-iron cluster-binding protein [Acidobacteria bacterium]|nr:NifB/NifX family molybdenum-iron cluster-binding protein [Acidobacteriota bacterium]
MKKIAVAISSDEGLESPVSLHFGRCPYYLLAEVEGEDIAKSSIIRNPFYHAHAPGVVPQFIKEQGAEVIIAGGMGGRAIDIFLSLGIEPVTGASGRAVDAISLYLKGGLKGASGCRDGR